VAFIGAILIIPESPKYLYSNKKFKEAKKSIARIAWINGSPMIKYKFDTEIVEEDSSRKRIEIISSSFK
jgi:hypothetical protein